MNVLDYLNTVKSPTDAPTSLTYVSMNMRDEFRKWLINGNVKKISPQVAIECIDKITEYVINKRMSCSIWDISNTHEYKAVFQKVTSAKLLRIMERKTYKTFTLVGQLYMKFLREKPWEVSSNNSVIATAHNELPTQNQPVEENNLNRTFSAQTQAKTNNFLFKKDVDLKLLKYGFTIPHNRLFVHFAQI